MVGYIANTDEEKEGVWKDMSSKSQSDFLPWLPNRPLSGRAKIMQQD